MTPFTLEDIPKIAPESPEPLATPVTGIPQSTSNPLLDVFGQADYRDDHEKAMDSWRQESATALDAAVLDPKSYGDERVPHGYTPDEWRKTRVVDDWMRLHTDGQEPPMDMTREFTRARLAEQVFGGAGAENDEALFGEITKAATGRKDVKELHHSLGQVASRAAAVALASPEQARSGWIEARDAARKMPGYSPELEPDLHESYYQAETVAREALAPFAPEVNELWKSWKEASGAGKIVGVAAGLIKDTFLGGQGETDAALDEKSTRRTAFEIYDKLTPEERPRFMQAISVMASSVPKEEQAKFFDNIGKQNGRDLETLGQQAVTGTVDFFANPDNWDKGSATGEITPYRRRADFVQQLQNVREGQFDPVKKVSDGYWGKLGEGVVYGTTGMLATSVMASNPVTAPILFASLTENHYQSLLQEQLDSGVDYEKASAYATRKAPEGAALETVSEMFGSHLLRGKLPFLDKFLTGAMDKLKNPLLRGATRFVVGGTEQGLQEVGQNYIDPTIRGISKAFGEDTGQIITPSAQENIETFVQVFPLALMGIPGAAGRDARVKTFAAARDVQLAAAGYTEEGIQNIRAGIAQGLDSGAAAIDGEVRDPNSESAKSAVEELMQQAASQRQAKTDLERLGYAPPSFVHSPAGVTVFDADGQELGTAPDIGGAVRIANAHTSALEEYEANYIASLTDEVEREKARARKDAFGTLAEASQAAVTLDPKSTLDVSFGVFDPAQATPGTAASYAQQVALKEKAEGGTGKIARSVLGYSVTSFAQGLRNTVNRLFEGASVTDVFHETAHGARRGAHAAGVLTLQHDIELLRSHDTVLAGRRVKAQPGERRGQEARFIPEGLTDEMLLSGEIPLEMIPPEFNGDGKLYVEKMMDEGVSEIVESEVFRPKKGQGKGKLGIGRAVVSRNITALAKLMPGTIGDWKAYFRAVRAQWGLALTRLVAMRGAERRGEWDPSTKDAYMAKLFGLDAQEEHDAGVQDEFSRMLAGFDDAEADDIPFSIGRSTVTPTKETQVFQGAEGSPSVIGPAAFSIGAYHGTPHQVDKFSIDKIGTGAGRQIYGLGIYFSSSKESAAAYAMRKGNGNLYAVSLDVESDELLDWDMPISAQGEKIVNALQSIKELLTGKDVYLPESNNGERTFREIRKALGEKDGFHEAHKAASLMLKDVGIHGIKVQGEGQIYVIFDESKIKITEENGKPVDIGGEGSFSIGTRYPRFNLRADGPTLYVKSNTGVLFPDGHEIQTNTAPPGTQADKGLWNRFMDDSGRARLSSGREATAAVAGSGTGIIDQIARHAESADRAGSFWAWLRATLNGEDFRGMDPLDLLDELVEVLELDGYKSEADGSRQLHYAQISPEGILLVADNSSGEFSFGRLPTKEEIEEAQFVNESNPAEFPSFSLGRSSNERLAASSKVASMTGPQRMDENTGLPLNDDGTVTLYHGTTKEGAAAIISTKVMKSAGEHRIYLTTDSTAETGYGDGTIVAVNVRPEMLELDDEFPDGRQDFAIDAPKKSISVAAAFMPGESSFSLGPAQVAGILSDNALGRITDPRRRTYVMSRIAKDFNAIRLQIERIASLVGIRRSKGDLRREANAREDLAAEAKIAAIHQRFGSLLADEDLVKIKQQPVHLHLADPTTPLRGRLMSKAAAIKANPEKYQLHRGGEYDGSDGVSRSVFGGRNMPDQAAQELFDHGLISEPTADAMWEALLAEQKTVAGMKDLLLKAKDQIREAKLEAKQEANEWLATQSKDQEVNFSDKEEIRRALRMLDAILLALPAEIRGKIGGYTQISMIGSDEARLAYLQDKLAKADKELETFLRVEYAKEWEALLLKAAPKTNEAGQRPTGSIAADAYEVFKLAEWAMGQGFAEGEAEATKWDSIADHEDTTEEAAALASTKAQMIRLTMNWTMADAARREQAVLAGDKIYFGGLRELKIEASRRRERLGKLRDSAITGTGKTGHRMELKAAEEHAKGSRIGKLKSWGWELLSFNQVIDVIFGENSAFAKWANAMEMACSNALEDGFQAKVNGLEALFDTLAGSRFGGVQLRHRLATVNSIQVKDALGIDQAFTEAEAITFLLMYRQEDGKRHMQGIMDDSGRVISSWGWDDASAAEVQKGLSKEGLAALAFLGNSYGEEYGRINAVFRRIWNVAMPSHKMYSPLSVKSAHGKADTITDPSSGETMGAGMTPSSLKNRSFSAIAEPDFKDAFQVYLTHARQMEHFIAYGEFSRDALAIINRREARTAIASAGGPYAAKILSGWMDYFALGGIQGVKAGGALWESLGNAMGRLAPAMLVGRVSVLAMQWLQTGAALFKMPTGAFLLRFAKLHTGQLNWGDAIHSPYIQRRLSEMPPAVRDMMRSIAAAPPNRAKYLHGQAGRSIAYADAAFTAGTYAIFYDYHLKLAKDMKMANPEAYAHSEAERLTDQVAQPIRPGARSWLEISTQGDPAFRAMWNFSTDPRQKFALWLYAMMRRDKTGIEKAKNVGITGLKIWLVGGIGTTVIRAIMRDMKNDDDDEVIDERHWNPKRLALMAAMGPFGGVPILGGMLEDATYSATGEYMPKGGVLSGLGDAAALPRKWAKGKVEPLKDIETMATGAATVSGTAGAAASAMHLIRDSFGIVDNFTDWGD